MTWKPDKRPVCWIWTGPQQWTLEEIQYHWPDRLNKCPLRRKGWGWPAGQNSQGFGAMYYGLDGLKRQAYVREYTKYRLAHKGTTLAIYGGSAWLNEYDNTGVLAWIDFYDPRKFRGMYEGCILPWMQELVGSDPVEWWWDAASGQGMKSLTGWLEYLNQRHGMRGGPEAIPMTAPGQPNLEIVKAYPCMASAPGFVDNPNMGIDKLDVHEWHEPHAYTPGPHDGIPEYTVAQCVSLLQRGWIVDGTPWNWPVVKAAYEAASVPLPAGSL